MEDQLNNTYIGVGARRGGGHQGNVLPQVFSLCHVHLYICPVLQIKTVPPNQKVYTSAIAVMVEARYNLFIIITHVNVIIFTFTMQSDCTAQIPAEFNLIHGCLPRRISHTSATRD